jgi:hypothetical protein
MLHIHLYLIRGIGAVMPGDNETYNILFMGKGKGHPIVFEVQ